MALIKVVGRDVKQLMKNLTVVLKFFFLLFPLDS